VLIVRHTVEVAKLPVLALVILVIVREAMDQQQLNSVTCAQRVVPHVPLLGLVIVTRVLLDKA